jgi:4-amino-4-deoxy-L-arabinose transferase-like glycosyltransferase
VLPSLSRLRLVGIAAALVGGVAFRVWIYRSALGAPDSDEAIVGLMARHALHGDFTVFFWGQPYGGSQEALLTAPLFAVFGTSLLALRIVPMLLTAAAAAVVWRVGRRAFGELPGAVAGLLVWLWPPYPIVHTTPAFGFYGATLLYCALLLLLALRIVEEPSLVRVALFGLVFGLAFWESAQIIPLAAPIIAWTLWRRPHALRHLWAALLAAAVGALPWLVWNVENDWRSVLARASLSAYFHGLRLFVSPLLPMLLGLRAPLTGQALLPKVLTLALYAILLLAFAWGAIRARRSNAGLLFGVALAFPFLWAISHRVAILTSHPIYLIVIAPVVALLLASVATTEWRAAVLLVAAAAVTAVTLQRMDTWLTADRPHWPPPTPRNLTPLIATLDELHLDHVYADYWIAYRLDLATDERIVATYDDWLHWTTRDGQVTPDPPLAVRWPAYQRQVASARHGFVFLRPEPYSNPIVDALRPPRYEMRSVGPFVIYAPRH